MMQNSEYYLWGAGTYGARFIEFMKNDLTFKAVIDNDTQKQGTVFHGVPVISYNEAKKNIPGAKIALALNLPTELLTFFLAEGLVKNRDFFGTHDFLPRYYWSKNKSLVVKSIDIAATTMCNLKCDGCLAYIPVTANSRHISSENILSDLRMLFTHVDSVMSINFGCGESLLNDELPALCSHISKNFAERYGWLLIQSNGTIIPSDDAMHCFSEAKANFGLSYYPENTKTLEKFIEKCNKFNVSWYLNYQGTKERWFDVGDPRVVSETNPEKLRARYEGCFKPGMGLYNGKLYICVTQTWSHLVAEVGMLEPGEAFDLRQPKTESSKEELYKIISRQPPECGYLSHCMRCNSSLTPYVPK